MSTISSELASEETLEVTGADDAYLALIARLSHQSVIRHYDAYADVDWDCPEFQIDPEDPRFELGPDDPLAATAWYRSQPPGIRARIGLHRIASNMKVGLQFESVLKRGLLEYAAGLPNGAPEFRYAYHEVIEEAQHSLMFQEFVNRCGLPVAGMPKILEFASRRVVQLGRRFPSLFFLFVLGGEDPIDFVQRSVLRSGREIHPLLERIMRIHVTEEARHLSFARHYLKREVPRLGWFARQRLAVATPFILGTMAAQMLRPSRQVVRTYAIPRSVLREAYRKDPAARQYVVDSLRKVRELCVRLGIITPLSRPLWRLHGIWGERPTTSQ
ncbi:MAG: AurF N-oxygenase family protein [Acidimicrobiales bacterium]